MIKFCLIAFNLFFCSWASIGIVHAGFINFDDLGPGTLVNTLDDVTFTSNILGPDLIVSNIFDTTSGDNYLGIGDNGNEVFLPGDIVELSFSIPITTLSINFISSPFTPGGIFSVESLFGTGGSSGVPTTILDDGGEVFPIDITFVQPVSVASLTSLNDGFSIYSYNIDDLQFTPVPIPSSFTLFGIGLFTLICYSNRTGTSQRL